MANREIEKRVLEAIEWNNENPGHSIAHVAREFDIKPGRLRRRLLGVQPNFGQPSANTKLSEPQELALVRYIDRLERASLAVRKDLLKDAANRILLLDTPDGKKPPTVGNNWIARFIRRKGFHVSKQKILDLERQKAENTDAITEYYSLLHDAIVDDGIQPEDIWNMDETGFRIGMGRDQLVVTRQKRSQYFGLEENRESATAIEAISASGRYLPLFLILTGKVHMDDWYKIKELHGDSVIGVNPTGYSNDETMFKWIQHFDHFSTIGQVGSHRLLVLDGHGSHHTREFIQYCDDHAIIPFGLPPHSTHLLQPLDVVVFQPYKHWHSRAVDQCVRDGIGKVTKLEFLGFIQDVRLQTFKEATIKSAFKKTGIHPFDANLVLNVLRERIKEVTPEPTRPQTPDGGEYSSPFGTPLTVRKTRKVGERLLDGDESHINKEGLKRFIKGVTVQSVELRQTMVDLSRTQLAEQIAKQRRSRGRRHIQTGGILTVEQGRAMVIAKEDAELLKAQKVVNRAAKRAEMAATQQVRREEIDQRRRDRERKKIEKGAKKASNVGKDHQAI